VYLGAPYTSNDILITYQKNLSSFDVKFPLFSGHQEIIESFPWDSVLLSVEISHGQ
jgi:hypothetical protein